MVNRSRSMDINRGAAEFQTDETALLLDVRTPQEYREGHIPGSRNIPLKDMDNAGEWIDSQDTPIYVYCHSGMRSSCAAAELREMGYTNVKDLGGIVAYKGRMER